MDIHAVTFEQLLDICASLEDAAEMKKTIEALELLEKNVRSLRTNLAGRLREKEQVEGARADEERKARRKSLRVVRPAGEKEKG
ncbi:MAG: hypothetical protein AB1640_06110 [bacterium]